MTIIKHKEEIITIRRIFLRVFFYIKKENVPYDIKITTLTPRTFPIRTNIRTSQISNNWTKNLRGRYFYLFKWSSSAKFWCWGIVQSRVYLVPVYIDHWCVPKCAVQLRVLCSVYQKGELPYSSRQVDGSLQDVLAFMVGLQHFWLHWISGQAVEWCL